jgi:hypothetical protein
MDYILLNALPITAATLAGFAFGALYYIALRAAYATASGTDSRARRSLSTYALIFLAQWWMAAILIGAIILAPAEASKWTMGLGSAVIIWIGFVAPTTLINTRLALRPYRLAFIDAVHWLGVMLIQASVMLLIGATPPT